MTRSNIGKLFFDLMKEYGVPVYLSESLPFDEITQERIVIIIGRTMPGKYWESTSIRINWCVPDINDEADGIRIEEIEKVLKDHERGYGNDDGKAWRYNKSSSETLLDASLRCHFVNISLTFQQQNIK